MQKLYYPAIGATEWVALETDSEKFRGLEVCVRLIARSQYKILAGHYAAILEKISALDPAKESAPSETERAVWAELDACHYSIIEACCAGLRPIVVGESDLAETSGRALAEAIDFIGLLHPVAQLVFSKQTPTPQEVNLSVP